MRKLKFYLYKNAMGYKILNNISVEFQEEMREKYGLHLVSRLPISSKSELIKWKRKHKEELITPNKVM